MGTNYFEYFNLSNLQFDLKISPDFHVTWIQDFFLDPVLDPPKLHTWILFWILLNYIHGLETPSKSVIQFSCHYYYYYLVICRYNKKYCLVNPWVEKAYMKSGCSFAA